MLVTFVLGSVHAFSVFMVPLEAQLLLPRSQISLIYSFTLVAITLSVLLGYRIYSLLPAWLLILLTCVAAACGIYLASQALSWWQLFLGYSVFFGISNGIGYGFCLQLVGRVMPEIKGFAMGAVTAAYAVGSILFAKIFAWQIASNSLQTALTALFIGLLLCGLIASICMAVVKVSFGRLELQQVVSVERLKVVQFWFAYMTSVFAGLMAIGHAAGIVLTKDGVTALATLGAMMIGIGSAVGGFLSGWLIDRWPATRFLVGLPLLSALSLMSIAFISNPIVVVMLLGVVGFSYGAIIAIYPVAISDYFGDQGPRIYGQVFTAWGFSGLVAPWVAGTLFDFQMSYAIALIVAALIAVVSALLARICRLEPVQ